MAKREKWSYQAGKRPHRVTVFERTPGGTIYGRAWDPVQERTVKRSLKHSDRDRAISWADKQAAKLRDGASDLMAGRATVGSVLDAYTRYHTTRKDRQKARDVDERAAEMWGRVLGRDADPHAVTLATWTRFIDDRANGVIDARGRRVAKDKRRPVRARTVSKSCKWLLHVFDWATEWEAQGRPLMRRNPLRSRRFQDAIPREKNPKRPTATRDRYEALRAVSDGVAMELRHHGKREQVRSYLSEILDLVVATGRRISAVCQLQYADFRLNDGTPHGSIRWRADSDKTGTETTIPINATARRAVDRIMSERPGVGTGWVFPAPGNPDKPIRYRLATRWLCEAEQLAELESMDGGNWHPFRRMWATERKHLPAKDVAEAGGWATTAMVSEVYQQADQETTLAVVLGGGELREAQ